MPLVFLWNGYRFAFWSNEGDPLEPAHIHVFKAGCQAKIWINPSVKLHDSKGFSARELRAIVQTVEDRRTEIEEAWNVHFDL